MADYPCRSSWLFSFFFFLESANPTSIHEGNEFVALGGEGGRGDSTHLSSSDTDSSSSSTGTGRPCSQLAFYPGDTTRCAYVVAVVRRGDRLRGASATPCSPKRLSTQPGPCARGEASTRAKPCQKMVAVGAPAAGSIHTYTYHASVLVALTPLLLLLST